MNQFHDIFRRQLMTETNIKEVVRQKYSEAAKRAARGGTACCGGGAELSGRDPITKDLYSDAETGALTAKAVAASLSCGNPTALAQLQPGEVVLDLGSGGGIDVILSARRVGPTGKADGLDMTDEMLALARKNQERPVSSTSNSSKAPSKTFPSPDSTVDVIISNCVINLSGDKDRVLSEAFRVLKPGGRFAISAVVVHGEVPADIHKSMELWVCCIAGALEEGQYREKLDRVGFQSVELEVTRVYRSGEAHDFLQAAGLDPGVVGPQIDGKFISTFVRAKNPQLKQNPRRPFWRKILLWPDLLQLTLRAKRTPMLPRIS
jgi:arsenite methyltransferase